ncbi:MAG TPA: dienelactone hydrolase family protein [Ktedonobacterales bacterium]
MVFFTGFGGPGQNPSWNTCWPLGGRLTEPFRQVCDRLAQAGFVAPAPDLYRGKMTTSVEAQHLYLIRCP